MLYPGRMSLEQLKKLPPAVVFSSEYDYLRRDAHKIIQKLK